MRDCRRRERRRHLRRYLRRLAGRHSLALSIIYAVAVPLGIVAVYMLVRLYEAGLLRP